MPQAVFRDKSTLYAVAAIFKFSLRNVRFYVGSPAGVLKLPSPSHSPPPSAAGSYAGSQPKAASESETPA